MYSQISIPAKHRFRIVVYSALIYYKLDGIKGGLNLGNLVTLRHEKINGNGSDSLRVF